jgi:hypothetical protein
MGQLFRSTFGCNLEYQLWHADTKGLLRRNGPTLAMTVMGVKDGPLHPPLAARIRVRSTLNFCHGHARRGHAPSVPLRDSCSAAKQRDCRVPVGEPQCPTEKSSYFGLIPPRSRRMSLPGS